MKKVLIGVAAVLVLAVGGFLAAVLMQPDELKVERSATIDASPEVLMPLCTDLKSWHAWSPWSDRDPNAKLTFSDPQ